MKKIMVLFTGLLFLLLWSCKSEVPAVSGTTVSKAESYTILDTDVKIQYAAENFVDLLKKTVDEWKKHSGPIEVTELTTQGISESLGCQVFKELVHFRTYILKGNQLIRIGEEEDGTGVEAIAPIAIKGAKTPNVLLYTVSAGSETAPCSRVVYYVPEENREYTFTEPFPVTDCTLKWVSNTEFGVYSGTPLDTGVMDPWMEHLGTVKATGDTVSLVLK